LACVLFTPPGALLADAPAGEADEEAAAEAAAAEAEAEAAVEVTEV